MARRPWYPFYVDDWEQDETVKLLDNHGRGIYLRLLNHEWRESSLPEHIPDLAVISGESLATFKRVWPKLAAKFPVCADGRRRNSRMQREIERAESVAQQSTQRSRQHRRNASRTHTQQDGDALQSQSQSHVQ